MFYGLYFLLLESSLFGVGVVTSFLGASFGRLLVMKRPYELYGGDQGDC